MPGRNDDVAPGFTRYLNVTCGTRDSLVWMSEAPPAFASDNDPANRSGPIRYSPLFVAYRKLGSSLPPELPAAIQSVAFIFAPRPYYALGSLKPELNQHEQDLLYFTQGLASIVVFNVPLERARELAALSNANALEFWNLSEAGVFDPASALIEMAGSSDGEEPLRLTVASVHEEPRVYIEQIAASIDVLWFSYKRYFPEEVGTLSRIASVVEQLIRKYDEVSTHASTDLSQQMLREKQLNAIVSALVELSAALSYSVTQGASGSAGVLSNPSPFPHHGLIGVGGAVRAMTIFTRYLESAFAERSAPHVIEVEYPHRARELPRSIVNYLPGWDYTLPKSAATVEEFDKGGALPSRTPIPLLTQFSLRHGFKESKFCVTAASESLSAENRPQWTLMTLSHEVMHSQVRGIFQALFGANWENPDRELIPDEHFESFRVWLESSASVPLDAQLRNVVFNYVLAAERADMLVATRRPVQERLVTVDVLTGAYQRHKLFAIELFVHFHDYYFVYASQPRVYALSLWATWIRVASPFARPFEYLVRSLATLACGLSSTQWEAFKGACEYLSEALLELEAHGVTSPLFDELRRIMKDDEDRLFAHFKPAHYLIQQIRVCLASQTIADRIDRIDADPFSEGSELAEEYSANVFVYPENDDVEISPVRYGLASLLRSVTGQAAVEDQQWLTAWNLMVIASAQRK